MSFVAVILAGAADRPVAALGDRTPLDVARLPALGALAGRARLGGVHTIPRKAPASFEAGVASLLGIDPLVSPPAAGGLLASALGVGIGPTERAFRLDLVNVYDGAIVDPTAGRMDASQAGILLSALSSGIGTDSIRLAPGDRWRNLVVFGDGQAAEVRVAPPASFLGEPLAEHLPRGPGAELVRGVRGRASDLLAGHEINSVRVDLGENPANAAWIWGGGRPESRPPLPGGGMAFGVHPSFRGLAREVGLTPRTVEVGTDPLDEPKRVAEAVRTALGSEEFLVVCLEGALLASRLGDVAGKVAYLEAVDRELIRPLSERVLSGGGRLLLTASHAVSVEERRDTRDVVPFLLCGEGTARYGDAAFTEAAALASDLVVDRGSTLLEFARRG